MAKYAMIWMGILVLHQAVAYESTAAIRDSASSKDPLIPKKPMQQRNDRAAVAGTASLNGTAEEKLRQCSYNIQIVTGCISDAGTDANVAVSFYTAGQQGVTFQDLDNSKDNFERCQTDFFTRSGNCLNGRICHMVLSHDNTGNKPGWYVSTVTVSVESVSSFFNLDRWLAKDEPPHSLSADVNNCR